MIWVEDNETDVSYDSSLLHPSSSVASTSRTRRAVQAFQRPPSFTGLTSASSSLSLVTSPGSSCSSDLSTTALSIVSQSSLSTSLLDFLEDKEEIYREPAIDRRPRSAQVSNSLPSPPQIPDPPVASRRPTTAPKSSIAAAPCYARRAEHSTQRTQRQKASKRVWGYKEISHKVDFLSQDLRRRDDTRRQESKEVLDSVTVLRDQMRDLHRIHGERIAAAITPPAIPKSRASRSAGASTEITQLEYINSGNNRNPEDLDYSRSLRDECVGSNLSSHYSDELAAGEYL